MLVDALAVCLPDDPEGNAKLMFSILECLPKGNRVRSSPLLFQLDVVHAHPRSRSNSIWYGCGSAAPAVLTVTPSINSNQ